MADFFEFLLAKPPGWAPEASKNSKKFAKGSQKKIQEILTTTRYFSMVILELDFNKFHTCNKGIGRNLNFETIFLQLRHAKYFSVPGTIPLFF